MDESRPAIGRSQVRLITERPLSLPRIRHLSGFVYPRRLEITPSGFQSVGPTVDSLWQCIPNVSGRIISGRP